MRTTRLQRRSTPRPARWSARRRRRRSRPVESRPARPSPWYVGAPPCARRRRSAWVSRCRRCRSGGAARARGRGSARWSRMSVSRFVYELDPDRIVGVAPEHGHAQAGARSRRRRGPACCRRRLRRATSPSAGDGIACSAPGHAMNCAGETVRPSGANWKPRLRQASASMLPPSGPPDVTTRRAGRVAISRERRADYRRAVRQPEHVDWPASPVPLAAATWRRELDAEIQRRAAASRTRSSAALVRRSSRGRHKSPAPGTGIKS